MSRKFIFGGSYAFIDADALAFLTATGITDATIREAINTLVVDMKGYGIWTKMKALYPFVGGTSTHHKYNLKDPRDLDAAFRLVFNGGITHSANGILSNGTNGYANTFFNPNNQLTINNTHLSIYSRTDGTSGIDIGATAASDIKNLFLAQSYFSNFYADSYSSSARFTLAAQTKGLLTISRTATNLFKAFKNNLQIGTTITSTSGSLPSWNIFLGATNRDGAPNNPFAYSGRNYAFASIGDGLTDTEAANYYTAVQAFQTALSRQV